MIPSADQSRMKRRNLLFFAGLVLSPLIRLIWLGLFRPRQLDRVTTTFSEIYSRLWDFAEHSISHEGFSLPSAAGGGAANRVNKVLAKLYGGQFASLSFGGSSGALLTLLTAVLPKLSPDRDLVLFDDLCHQSAIGGLIFGHWKAIRLVRGISAGNEVIGPVTLKNVKTQIDRYGPEQFAAIILVLPSYDGFRSPSEEKKIYDYAKSHGISVIVDGAWDALRFRKSEIVPPPLASICDVWITSPHKRGLTPSSLGCIVTKNETIARLWDEALDLGFRSSSVSFVEIMIAEHRLVQIADGAWDEAFSRAEAAAKILSERVHDIHPALHIVEPRDVGAETHDPTHILISTQGLPDFDARKWASILSREFALDVEKSTATTLLLLCGSPDHLARMDEIIDCLKKAFTLTQKQGRNYDR